MVVLYLQVFLISQTFAFVSEKGDCLRVDNWLNNFKGVMRILSKGKKKKISVGGGISSVDRLNPKLTRESNSSQLGHDFWASVFIFPLSSFSKNPA